MGLDQRAEILHVPTTIKGTDTTLNLMLFLVGHNSRKVAQYCNWISCGPERNDFLEVTLGILS